jgi:putative Holliday junction resolvase
LVQGRILGIDAGERRVGLALTDEMALLATPLRVIERGRQTTPVIAEIEALVQAEAVAKVIVGLPLNADGSHGRQAKRAEAFGAILRRVLPIPVEFWDERRSTLEAHRLAREAHLSPGHVDALAAAVILQDYLSAHGSGSLG